MRDTKQQLQQTQDLLQAVIAQRDSLLDQLTRSQAACMALRREVMALRPKPEPEKTPEPNEAA
jgi:hypothetical protein